MPLFEYICRNCGKFFETLVRPNDVDVACTGCGSTNIEKQFSKFGVGGPSDKERARSQGSNYELQDTGFSLRMRDKNAPVDDD